VTRWRELTAVSVAGLAARASRTALILLGPVLGAAGIVASVGLNESATGDVRATLDRLGTNLIVATADGTFSAGEAPVLPADAVRRALNVSTVDRVAGVTQLAGVSVVPSAGGETFFRTVPVPVLTADADLLDVLDVDMATGRFISPGDERLGVRVAVLGEGLADDYQYLPGELRTVDVGGVPYGVIGVLRRPDLVPDFDTAVILPRTAAEEDFDVGVEPTTLYVRADEEAVDATADVLAVAINLGGSESVSVAVPSDLLEARGAVDETLRNVLILMGGLALLVGGVGIANVMSISVIQRSAEIGIRRALGHTRSTIALQFLFEAAVIGLLGGVLGVALGIAAIAVVSSVVGWVASYDPTLFVAAAAMSLVVSIVAGLYPATKAARLEPLETLRLG
jgi:putative ABC transport system permease protein